MTDNCLSCPEKLNNLSDEKIEERADKAFDRFKDKLKEYYDTAYKK
jgi:hypothetical protein